MNREIIQQLLVEMQEVFVESFEEIIKDKNYAGKMGSLSQNVNFQ